jgi:hypothetical protein
MFCFRRYLGIPHFTWRHLHIHLRVKMLSHLHHHPHHKYLLPRRFCLRIAVCRQLRSVIHLLRLKTFRLPLWMLLQQPHPIKGVRIGLFWVYFFVFSFDCFLFLRNSSSSSSKSPSWIPAEFYSNIPSLPSSLTPFAHDDTTDWMRVFTVEMNFRLGISHIRYIYYMLNNADEHTLFISFPSFFYYC